MVFTSFLLDLKRFNTFITEVIKRQVPGDICYRCLSPMALKAGVYAPGNTSCHLCNGVHNSHGKVKPMCIKLPNEKPHATIRL